AGRNAWFSGAAIALGEGSHPGGLEGLARHFSGETAVAVKGRSIFAPDAEHFLSAHAGGLGADAAGDDRALLHGPAADGISGFAAHHRLVLVDLRVLCHRVSRAVS